MTPTEKFWNFFKPICEAAPGVIYTQLSDSDRLDRWLADSRSEDTYPGVFVFRPRYSGSYDAVFSAYFDVVFYVFDRGELDDYDKQDEAFRITEDIQSYIVSQVLHQAYEGKCFFDITSLKAEPVAFMLIDSAWGYEVKLRIGLLTNDIYC